MPKGEIESRVQEMLQLVKLESFAKRKPHQLSGGQRQRVALARSLAKRPKVLLLDEPLGALDKKLREETQFELMDLQMKLGMTFLIVTHDQEEAMTMADRIAVMDQGRLVQVAHAGRNLRAAGDALRRRLHRRHQHVRGHRDGRRRPGLVRAGRLPHRQSGRRSRPPARPRPAARSWFAVRPEKVRISLDPPAAGPTNASQGEVWDIGYLGDVYGLPRASLAGGADGARHRGQHAAPRRAADHLGRQGLAQLRRPIAGVLLTR